MLERDRELMDKIMSMLEKDEKNIFDSAPIVESYSQEAVVYHVWLLGEEGLLDVHESTDRDSISREAIPINITREGYSYLESIRKNKIHLKLLSWLKVNFDKILWIVIATVIAALVNHFVQFI